MAVGDEPAHSHGFAPGWVTLILGRLRGRRVDGALPGAEGVLVFGAAAILAFALVRPGGRALPRRLLIVDGWTAATLHHQRQS